MLPATSVADIWKKSMRLGVEFVIKVEGGAGFSPLENQAGSRPRLTLLREHLGPPRPSGEVGASAGRSQDGNWRQSGVRVWAELN